MVCSRELSGIIGTDQTGRFPTTSDRGHKYIFTLFDEDVNLIYTVPIESRKTSELIRAYEICYTELVRSGFEPVLHRIDNETSIELEAAIRAKGLVYETVPPGNHRSNPAEQAIQTFKSHFISVLNGVDKDYPKRAWDYLIPQTNMTMNMLRQCTINPAHSAYSYIYGPYDFNAHPLAPLGCRAIVHQRAVGKGGKRGTWENRGKVGYYIGPKMSSYRVWRFYMPDTGGIQESDTAEFFPKSPLPVATVGTTIAESLNRIEEVLDSSMPPHTIFPNDDSPNDAIHRLREMCKAEPTDEGEEELTTTTVEVPATPPRVPMKTDQSAEINKYQPKKKQRFPIGTRVRIVEKQKGRKTVTLIGKATEYSPYTGLYKVVFPDGEFEEFDDEEMEYFRLINRVLN
jgi:hypothetical protein